MATTDSLTLDELVRLQLAYFEVYDTDEEPFLRAWPHPRARMLRRRVAIEAARARVLGERQSEAAPP